MAEQEQQQPSSTEQQKDLERPSAEEIYTQVANNARAELRRTSLALGFPAWAEASLWG